MLQWSWTTHLEVSMKTSWLFQGDLIDCVSFVWLLWPPLLFVTTLFLFSLFNLPIYCYLHHFVVSITWLLPYTGHFFTPVPVSHSVINIPSLHLHLSFLLYLLNLPSCPHLCTTLIRFSGTRTPTHNTITNTHTFTSFVTNGPCYLLQSLLYYAPLIFIDG